VVVEYILAAIVLVFIGAVFLAALTGVAWIFLLFLLAFWPAITGVALALAFAGAGHDVPASLAFVGGIAGNLYWWLHGCGNFSGHGW